MICFFKKHYDLFTKWKYFCFIIHCLGHYYSVFFCLFCFRLIYCSLFRMLKMVVIEEDVTDREGEIFSLFDIYFIDSLSIFAHFKITFFFSRSCFCFCCPMHSSAKRSSMQNWKNIIERHPRLGDSDEDAKETEVSIEHPLLVVLTFYPI